MRQQILTWFPRLAALTLFGLAIGWAWTFGFTHFRLHLRLPMLVVAAATLVYAVFLAALNRWAVLSPSDYRRSGLLQRSTFRRQDGI
jgi:hypothetical protein